MMATEEKEGRLPKENHGAGAPAAVCAGMMAWSIMIRTHEDALLDQLVSALYEAFLEGGPQCSRKRK